MMASFVTTPGSHLCSLQKRSSGVVSNAPRAADAGHGEVEGWPPETLISAELTSPVQLPAKLIFILFNRPVPPASLIIN